MYNRIYNRNYILMTKSALVFENKIQKLVYKF